MSLLTPEHLALFTEIIFVIGLIGAFVILVTISLFGYRIILSIFDKQSWIDYHEDVQKYINSNPDKK